MREQLEYECPPDSYDGISEYEPRYDENGDFIPECPEKLVAYARGWNEYGIPIQDYRGGGWALIRFCPWCGANLGPSFRLSWFEILDALGLEPEDDLPERLRDDRWWRDRDDPPLGDDAYPNEEPVQPVDPATRIGRGGLKLSRANLCCDRIEAWIVEEDERDLTASDRVIGFDPTGGAALIVHSRPARLRPIAHCPWCGVPTDTAS